MGTIVGFVVGMLISYQVIYTDLSDQLPQYATLKAMGYRTGYLLARGVRAGGLQRLGRVGPGLAVEPSALLRDRAPRAAAAAHDGLIVTLVQPRLDLGDVPDLGRHLRCGG